MQQASENPPVSEAGPADVAISEPAPLNLQSTPGSAAKHTYKEEGALRAPPYRQCSAAAGAAVVSAEASHRDRRCGARGG